MTFVESDVSRDLRGRFDEKAHSPAEVTLRQNASGTAAREVLAVEANRVYREFYEAKRKMMQEMLTPAVREAVHEYLPDATSVRVSLDHDGFMVEDITLGDGTVLEYTDDRAEASAELVLDVLRDCAQSLGDIRHAGGERNDRDGSYSIHIGENA